MTITESKQRYTLHPNVSGALHLLADDQVQHLYLSGLNGSAAPLFASTLMGQIKAPMLFVLGDVEEAGYFYHDLVQLLDEERVMFFPSSFRRAIKYGQKDAANEILRTEVLSRILPRRLGREGGVARRTEAEDAQDSRRGTARYGLRYRNTA